MCAQSVKACWDIRSLNKFQLLLLLLYWLHACRPGPSTGLRSLPLQLTIHTIPTHLSELFLSEQSQHPWANKQANKCIKENHVKQLSFWPIVKVHVPKPLCASEEPWSLQPTCYLCLGWHIDATAGGMNGCLEISFAWFIICFKLSGLHLSGPTGSLLLI